MASMRQQRLDQVEKSLSEITIGGPVADNDSDDDSKRKNNKKTGAAVKPKPAPVKVVPTKKQQQSDQRWASQRFLKSQVKSSHKKKTWRQVKSCVAEVNFKSGPSQVKGPEEIRQVNHASQVKSSPSQVKITMNKIEIFRFSTCRNSCAI